MNKLFRKCLCNLSLISRNYYILLLDLFLSFYNLLISCVLVSISGVKVKDLTPCFLLVRLLLREVLAVVCYLRFSWSRRSFALLREERDGGEGLLWLE